MARVVGVVFKKASKTYNFDPVELDLKSGDLVVVESEKGIALGRVSCPPKEKGAGGFPQPLKRVIRKADEADMERLEFSKERGKEALKLCKEKIEKYNLPMKLVDVDYLFDSSKAVFYFISDVRVDFRALVKDLATEFYTRIEMRQLGVRHEAKHLGGIGPCGREICCATFLVDFEPVTVKMAKEQNISVNPAKIAGLCGRLMCCLTYEYDAKNAGKKMASGDCSGCKD